MTRSSALLFSVALLAAPSSLAETVVRADWEKARTMLTQEEFRPRIEVELKSPKRVIVTKGSFHDRKRTEVELKPTKWVKGQFIEATDEGLRVVFRRAENRFSRENIRRIRLTPNNKNRRIGVWLGIPVGVGIGFVAAKTLCVGDGCGNAHVLAFLVGIPIAVSYAIHKFGGGGRTGRKTVIVVLDESTANKPPVPSQAAGPSPASRVAPSAAARRI